ATTLSPLRGRSLPSFLSQCPEGHDGISLHAPKPPKSELVALSCHRDGPIGTAAPLVGLPLGDDLNKKSVGFRPADARALPGAVKIRISCLCSAGVDYELESVGCLTAHLGKLSAPASVDTGTGRRGRRFLALRRSAGLAGLIIGPRGKLPRCRRHGCD